jgi:hypothetical protein
MRLIVAMSLALLPLAAAATPAPQAPQAPQANGASAPAKCDRFGRMDQASVLRLPDPQAQRLDQLPPGDLHLTVEREVNGCHEAVIVRENIGGAAFRRR